MENTLITNLKAKTEELKNKGIISAEVQRNVIKEQLHYYVLDFIYNHPEYSKWTMYGGSVLRICHELNRMSVDLDFEVEKMPDFKKLKDRLAEHFKKNYDIDPSVLDIVIKKRGVVLKFNIARELNISQASPKVHVKIDLNEFKTKDASFDMIPTPTNEWHLPFVIKTYNLGGLMASKIAAVFGRGERGLGKIVADYKGRDIYDLLWYMEKKVIPDIGYLKAKGFDFSDIREIFDRLTVKIGKLNESMLKEDLPSLFTSQDFINNWLKNWRAGYFRLKDDYNMHKIEKLVEIRVWNAFETGNLVFDYIYETDDQKTFTVRYRLDDYWLTFREGKLDVPVNKDLVSLVSKRPDFRSALSDRLDKYITLFSKKTDNYFKETNRIVLGKGIITRLIRMTADNLDHQDQVMIDRSALLSCGLKDLMK